jgi:hypothetical protein
VLGGSIELGAAEHAIGAGWVSALAYSYRLLDERGARPFVLLSGSFGATSSTTTLDTPGAHTERLFAVDLRAGVAAGYTIAGKLHPYAALRAFGGPISWRIDRDDALGSDDYHYQPALGLVLTLPPVDLHVEGAFVGERQILVGAGLAL